MARPPAHELTERELEIMHVFWDRPAATRNSAQKRKAKAAAGGEAPADELTVADVRDALADAGRELAYTTVATLVRILHEKGFLEQTHAERPFRYRSLRSFEEVSGSLLGDMVKRVFGGSREQLLVRLVEQRKLSARERALLEGILKETD